MVLSLCWSIQTDIIASGGEDYLYKLWTSQGVNLFTSSREEDSITSLSFNPEREIIVVGTFNILKLCGNVGVSGNSGIPLIYMFRKLWI